MKWWSRDKAAPTLPPSLPADTELIDKLRWARVISALPHVHMIPGLDTQDDVLYIFGLANHVMRTVGKERPPVIVEVGCFAGRLSRGLVAAVVESDAWLYLVDTFQSLDSRDADATKVEPWATFRRCQEVSGLAFGQLLSFQLHQEQLTRERTQIVHARGWESTGKGWDAIVGQSHEPRIDLLVLSTFLTYQELLDSSNGWLRWLRPGGLVQFMDAGSNKDFAGIAREVVQTKRWGVVGARQSAGRSGLLLQRPLDDTSGGTRR